MATKKKIKITFKTSLNKTISAIKMGLIYGMLSFLLFIFIYSLSAIMIFNFGDNSRLLTTIATKMQIPALISRDGVIYFERYKNIVDDTKVDVNNKLLFNEELARVFILDSLFKKHNVASVEELKEILVFDEEVNMAPINRIKKIKETIQAGDSFIKIATKFGDVYQANINKDNASDFAFSDNVKGIQTGETSDIIIAREGYYIVHCFERAEDALSLSYVYIPTVSLDEYLVDSSKDYKFWNLTNF